MIIDVGFLLGGCDVRLQYDENFDFSWMSGIMIPRF